MGITEQQRAYEVEKMANELNWTKAVISAVASRFGIVGASEPNLSKAFAKTKDLSSQTAANLKNLLWRFMQMTTAFEPFKLRLDDPDRAKELLEDYEAGKLVVSVSRYNPARIGMGQVSVLTH